MIRESGQLRELDVTALSFEVGKERLRDDRKPLALRMNDVPAPGVREVVVFNVN